MITADIWKRLLHRRRNCAYIALPIILILAAYHLVVNTYIIADVGYLARPLWDEVHEKWTIIPHYNTEGVPAERACELHGWQPNNGTKPRVIDAVIFSVELDMYEVRLRELWDVVDVFLVLESNATFTGEPKPLTFAENTDRFAFAKEKIVHRHIDQYQLPPNESPFYNEGRMRYAMNQHIEQLSDEGDLIIMSDVDEIPRASTLKIIKACKDVPSPLHLQLRNYLYSYEFPVDFDSWRARIERYNKDTTKYSHGQKSLDILADAGKKTGT
jgi:beta-1,4-mannosyl-glycoprotein beta-1,4-N-acetylglucosaminyltransferase